jgi:Uma2 family endonuclease
VELSDDESHQGAPDLVVEVGSPSRRRHDELIKHQLAAPLLPGLELPLAEIFAEP